MSQSGSNNYVSPTCTVCRMNLSPEVHVQCPQCSTNCCARCFSEHYQIHMSPRSQQSAYTAKQQVPYIRYQSYQYSPRYGSYLKPPPPPPPEPSPHSLQQQQQQQQTPYFPPPPETPLHPRQQHHQFVPYFPPPPPPQNQPPLQHPPYIPASPRSSVNALPPTNQAFKTWSAPSAAAVTVVSQSQSQTGHRNWIAAAVDKGTMIAKHKDTKKFFKKSGRFALAAASIAIIGADLTSLDGVDFGGFSGDGGTVDGADADVAPVLAADSSTAAAGGTVAPSGISAVDANMVIMNSTAFFAPNNACVSMNGSV